MPTKNYKKRIAYELAAFRDDPDRDAEHYRNPDHDDGDMFYWISDHVLDASETDPIKRAFGDANLDPKNVFHWLYLLEQFAITHYQNKAPGAKKARTSLYLKSFLKTFKSIQKKQPDATNEAIFAKMRKATPDDLKLTKLQPATLRGIYSEAKQALRKRTHRPKSVRD